MGKKTKEQEQQATKETEETESKNGATVLDYDGIPINVKETGTFHLIESCSRHVDIIHSILRLLMGASASRHGEDELADHMYGVLNEMETKLGYVEDIIEEIGERLSKTEKAA